MKLKHKIIDGEEFTTWHVYNNNEYVGSIEKVDTGYYAIIPLTDWTGHNIYESTLLGEYTSIKSAKNAIAKYLRRERK